MCRHSGKIRSPENVKAMRTYSIDIAYWASAKAGATNMGSIVHRL